MLQQGTQNGKGAATKPPVKTSSPMSNSPNPPTQAPISNGQSATAHPSEADGKSGVDGQQNKKTILQGSRWKSIKDWFSSYFAAFTTVGVIIQFIASVTTVALYVAPQRFFFLSDTIWYAPVNAGLLSYLIIWPFAALIFRSIATIEGGNSRSYGLLRARYHQLIARLGPEEYDPFPKEEGERIRLAKLTNPQPYQLVALHEAYRCMESVCTMLKEHSTGLLWVMGFGYITAWGMLHRAEEALVEIEPLPLVVRGAMHDKWAIQHSQIANRDELLETIIQAVADVDEGSLIHFKEHQPGTSNKDLSEIQHELNGIKKTVTELTEVMEKRFRIHISSHSQAASLNGSAANTVSNANWQPWKLPLFNADAKSAVNEIISPETRGRFALHEVRRTLNQYRDSLWEGLVRARNQVWSTAALTALITHILVCTAIIVGSSKDNIVAGTMFYITGAMAGLFIRFYRETTTSSAVDDYGLSTIRLIVTPLLSGLAALGGVLIVSLLYGASLDASSATIQSIPSLAKIFLLDNPLRLLAAAIFGIAPNLIIKSLQNQTEKYATDLQKSSTVTGTSSDGTAS